MEIAALLLGGIICGILAACIAKAKGRSAAGWFFVGLFSSLVGVLVAALAGSRRKREPPAVSPSQPSQLPSQGARATPSLSQNPLPRDVVDPPAPPPTGTTAARSVEEVVAQLLQGVLGDVIPLSEKERKQMGRNRRSSCPVYTLTFRTLGEGPDYDSNENRNDRIQCKLKDIGHQIENGPWFKLFSSYVDIARIPTVLVREVKRLEKSRARWETVFRNWP